MILGTLLAAIICFVLAGLGFWRLRRRLKPGWIWWTCVVGMVLCAEAAALCGIDAAGYGWFFHRSQPAPIKEQLFRGVEYERIVQRRPWPMVAHVIRIDLTTPGLGFMTTPPEQNRRLTGGRAYRAMKTTDFLKKVRGQIAINANLYMPYHNGGPFDYYPHEGDPVDVAGYCASGGVQIAPWNHNFRSLQISSEGAVTMTDDRITTGFNAVSGLRLPLDPVPAELLHQRPREPRTAVALDRTGKMLIIVAVDGRQPNYSEGATEGELSELVKRLGGDEAINLDGGGSSALAVAKKPGRVQLINTPCNSYIPGWERPVGNHLAIFAVPL